jgi:hypothetical protein
LNPTLSERLRRRGRHRPRQFVEPSSFWVPAEPPTAVAALMQCRAGSDPAALPPPAPAGAPRRDVILVFLVWMLVVLIDGALAAVALVRAWSRRPHPARRAALRLEAVP